MKKAFLTTTIILVLISCKKKKEVEPVPTPEPYVIRYPQPWKTEFITYKNIFAPDCGGGTGRGYKLFYKDTMISASCGTYHSGWILGNPLKVDDSTMLLTKTDEFEWVTFTRNGGYSWSEKQLGPRLLKYQTVHSELVYCICSSSASLHLTGIDKSSLSNSMVPYKKGRHYFFDPGAKITDRDSTEIKVNDSITLVVKFK